MSDSSIEVRPVTSKDELRQATELMAKTHGQNYFSSMEWLERHGNLYPGFFMEHTRTGYYQGELAGALRLTTETLRIGEARLKMGGIGWVTTDPKFRKLGVATALMDEVVQYMLQHQYHVSMLFGIPRFYHRFEYATSLSDYSIHIDVAEIPAPEEYERYRLRKVKPGDIQTIQRIHQEGDRFASCSILRSQAHITNKWEQFQHAQVMIDQHGAAIGYFLGSLKNTTYHIREAGALNAAAIPFVLAGCAATAKSMLLRSIVLDLPPYHSISTYLKQFNAVFEMKREHDRGGMLRFIDLEEAMESMIPEWEIRVSDTLLRELKIEVTFMVDGVPYRLRSIRGAIDINRITGNNKFSVTGQELLYLVTGYIPFNEIYDEARRLISPSARLLLEGLFPERNPYVYNFDRF
jgi:predicted acetyltransferase